MKSKPIPMSLQDHMDLAKKINEAKLIIQELVALHGPKCSVREENILYAAVRPIDKAIGHFEDKMFRDHKAALDQLRTDRPESVNPDLRIYYP